MKAKSMKSINVKTVIRWIIYVILGLIIIGVISLAALFVYANSFVDTSFMAEVNNYKLNFSSVIYGYDRTKNDYVEVEFLHDGENRIWVDIDKVPKNLSNAFIAIEDKRFYSHNGVDWRRTAGAIFNFITGSDKYGGSTITQQFIKNITGDNSARPDRKIREIVRAIQLEKKLTKEEILELYMNTLYMGSNYYGVQAAANGYFGKDVSKLNLAECASLAGITNLPSKYNPITNPEDNKKRQEIILGEMLEQNMITQKQYNEAIAYKLVFNKSINSAKSTNKQSYFADQLITQIIGDLQSKGYSKEAATNMIYSGGLKIYSTMEPSVQKAMTDVFSNTSNFPTLSGSVQPEAAMIIIEPKSGDVVAMYGGRGPKTADRTLNRAVQITRSPGSTIKPISVYAPSIENNVITSGDIFEDSPFNKELMWPKNYYEGYKGNMTVQYAIAQSVNTVAVKVLAKLTPQKSFDFLQNNLKVSTLVKMSNGKTDIDYSPLALGGLTKGISVLELAAAYVPFDNGGIYSKPRIYAKVVDTSGNTILETKQESSQAMGEDTAFIMNKLLQNVVNEGTGTLAQLKGGAQKAAGKTGTTDDDTDRWFVGFTPYYVGAVWFGYDSPKTVAGVSVNPALALWKLVMEKVHANLTNQDFPADQSNVIAVQYCTKSGKLPGAYCPSEDIDTAWYKKGTQPTKTCDVHNLLTAVTGGGSSSASSGSSTSQNANANANQNGSGASSGSSNGSSGNTSNGNSGGSHSTMPDWLNN